jgi:hypothetical protein
MNYLTVVCRKVRLNGHFIIEGQVLARYGAKVCIWSEQNFEHALSLLHDQLRLGANDRVLFESKDVKVLS